MKKSKSEKKKLIVRIIALFLVIALFLGIILPFINIF